MPPRQHMICLTIDTDPDGLNTHHVDRSALVWDGLHFAMDQFHTALPEIPLTWYVRADGQLEAAYGSLRYLFDKYADFWQAAIERGDELGWHPHLYTRDDDPQIITDSKQATSELQHIWNELEELGFDLPTFRMGEGWHTAQTLNLVEALGFGVDSTAIPGRDDSATGHPRNWKGTPNQPYYPAHDDIRRVGERRSLLEVPMNSWFFQTSYDKAPKLRYMNPCIHPDLWQQALAWWEANLPDQPNYIWNLILHPAEAMPHDKPDLLYAYSLDSLAQNLDTFMECIQKIGDSAQFTTIARAAQTFR